MHVNIVTGINLPGNHPPARAYVHGAGFEDVYHGRREEAKSYLLESLSRSPVDLSLYDYLILVAWGDEDHNRIIDFFGGSDMPSQERWRIGNLDFAPWNIVNGVYAPREEMLPSGLIKVHPHTCEDSEIIVGQEGMYRRGTSGFDEYIKNPPRSLIRFFKD